MLIVSSRLAHAVSNGEEGKGHRPGSRTARGTPLAHAS